MMKMSSILFASLAAAAWLIIPRPCAAQLGGNVIIENGTTDEGTFHVVATQESTYVWNVNVKYVNTLHSPAPEYPYAFLDGVTVSFYNGASVNGTQLENGNTFGSIVSATGSVGTFDWTAANGNAPGIEHHGEFYQFNDSSFTPGQNQIKTYDQDGLISLDATGTLFQTFNGTVTLNSSLAPYMGSTYAAIDSNINVVEFGLQNSGEVNAAYMTPEGSSLAYFLFGSIPLGLCLVRRRRN